MPTDNNTQKLKMVLAMSIFGTIGLVRRFIPYSSGIVAFARGLIGTAFLLVLMAVRKERLYEPALKKNLPLLAASGALIGFNWILLFEAYRYTTVAVATICYYMEPVFLVLLSPVFFKEKLTVKKLLCVGAAFYGMILVSGVLETGFSGARGMICGLCAAMMYTSVIILNKYFDELSPKTRTVFQLGTAAAALIPYLIITEDFGALAFDAKGMLFLAIAGIVHTGMTYTMYFESVEKLPAQTVALLAYIDPVVAVLCSVLILKEPMTASAAAGVVLVIGAAIVSELKGAGNKAA